MDSQWSSHAKLDNYRRFSLILAPSSFYNHHFNDVFYLAVYPGVNKDVILEKRWAFWVFLTKTFFSTYFAQHFDLNVILKKREDYKPQNLSLVAINGKDTQDYDYDDILPSDAVDDESNEVHWISATILNPPKFAKELRSLPSFQSVPLSKRVNAWLKSSHLALADDQNRFGPRYRRRIKFHCIPDMYQPFVWTLNCSGKQRKMDCGGPAESQVLIGPGRGRILSTSNQLKSNGTIPHRLHMATNPFRFVLHVVFHPPTPGTATDMFGIKLEFVEKVDSEALREFMAALPEVHDKYIRDAFKLWIDRSENEHRNTTATPSPF